MEKPSEVPPLVSDPQYAGLFVATASFKDNHVLASGKNAAQVRDEAVKQGIKTPVVFFVPDNDMVHIY
ncbi:MAG: hypothetical protein JW936_00475 [Sedimentisphaerales bacterium]|nr:hypothetical protein [Sedimentisphaerales bacterium]